MEQTSPSSQREMVFCHGCENEWYRDEHGLVCPECNSDFTEIIEDEGPNALGSEDDTASPDELEGHEHRDFYAPDPDEDDIENLRWEETAPGRYRVRGTYHTTISRNDPQMQGQGQPGLGAVVTGLLGNLIQGWAGDQQQQQQQQLQQQRQRQLQQQLQQQPQQQQLPEQEMNIPRQQSPPPGTEQQHGNPGGPSIRHGHGPGFSYTIATSSNATFGGVGGDGGPLNRGANNLFPRNAHAPQPFQAQPENIDRMLQQILAEVGALNNGGAIGGGMRGAAAPPGQENAAGATPFLFGGPNGMAGGLANILQLFGPPGGVAGDAVYTQEAFDRIMTQLREQHGGHGVPAASAAAIAGLPRKNITTADFGEAGKAECSICMDEVPLGDSVTQLPCGHWFHGDCIKSWLSEHDSCPHCRQGIMPKGSNGDEGDGAATQPRSPGQPPLHDLNSPVYAGSASPAHWVSGESSSAAGGAVDGGETEFASSSGSERPQSSGSGIFSRMREAFSRDSGGGTRGPGNDEVD